MFVCVLNFLPVIEVKLKDTPTEPQQQESGCACWVRRSVIGCFLCKPGSYSTPSRSHDLWSGGLRQTSLLLVGTFSMSNAALSGTIPLTYWGWGWGWLWFKKRCRNRSLFWHWLAPNCNLCVTSEVKTNLMHRLFLFFAWSRHLRLSPTPSQSNRVYY